MWGAEAQHQVERTLSAPRGGVAWAGALVRGGEVEHRSALAERMSAHCGFLDERGRGDRNHTATEPPKALATCPLDL